MKTNGSSHPGYDVCPFLYIFVLYDVTYIFKNTIVVVIMTISFLWWHHEKVQFEKYKSTKCTNVSSLNIYTVVQTLLQYRQRYTNSNIHSWVIAMSHFRGLPWYEVSTAVKLKIIHKDLPPALVSPTNKSYGKALTPFHHN